MKQGTRPRTAHYAATTAEVPRPACGRCDDWTTVIHKGNRISPCPTCRPDAFDAWRADSEPAG